MKITNSGIEQQRLKLVHNWNRMDVRRAQPTHNHFQALWPWPLTLKTKSDAHVLACLRVVTCTKFGNVGFCELWRYDAERRPDGRTDGANCQTLAALSGQWVSKRSTVVVMRHAIWNGLPSALPHSTAVASFITILKTAKEVMFSSALVSIFVC